VAAMQSRQRRVPRQMLAISATTFAMLLAA
jgi:hypothetical protein